MWCLVSAYSSSWYVLYLFVWFSFWLLSTCVTTGWIFEISLCANSFNQSIVSCLRIDLPGFRRRRQLVVCTKPDAASVNVPSRESVSTEATPPPPDFFTAVQLLFTMLRVLFDCCKLKNTSFEVCNLEVLCFLG